MGDMCRRMLEDTDTAMPPPSARTYDDFVAWQERKREMDATLSLWFDLVRALLVHARRHPFERFGPSGVVGLTGASWTRFSQTTVMLDAQLFFNAMRWNEYEGIEAARAGSLTAFCFGNGNRNYAQVRRKPTRSPIFRTPQNSRIVCTVSSADHDPVWRDVRSRRQRSGAHPRARELHPKHGEGQVREARTTAGD